MTLLREFRHPMSGLRRRFGDAEWLENGVACGWRLGSGEAKSGFTSRTPAGLAFPPSSRKHCPNPTRRSRSGTP